MHSRRSFGQLLPVPPFSRLSRFSPRLLFVGVLGLGVAFSASAGLARAQNASSPGSNPTAERFTQDLVAQTARYHRAGPADQARLLSNLLTAAADRQQLLASLIENDPGEVLRVALPAAIRASLPPAVQAYVEEEVEVEGELEVLIEDYAKKSRTLFFLETARERLSLHFAANPPKHLLTGAQVRLKGVQIDGALALASGDTSIETLALDSSSTSTATTATYAALPNTFGAQKTLVILVNFQDNPTQQPWTPDQVRSSVFGTVSNFFLENSYQQTWLTGDVYGWYTIPISSTTCDATQIATASLNAATAAAVNVSAYSRRVYVFPYNSNCVWAGQGTLGGLPSDAWINGGTSFVASDGNVNHNGPLDTGIVAHEMGHNLGLYHSHALECGAATLGSTCSSIEYGDTLDTMGGGQGHYNAFQKERLGWLNYGVSPLVTTATTSGTYSLGPYETSDANPKALKILKFTNPTTGLSTWYYIEYRQPLGFDAFISSMPDSNVSSGVVVQIATDSSPNSSDLLDMTPMSSTLYDWNDVALVAGKSYYDSDAGLTITPASASSTGASVNVSLSPPSCVRAVPNLSISPSQAGPVLAGTPVTYTVSLTNNDGSNCGVSTFNLPLNIPYGWTATIGSSALTLSPGAVGSTSLTVTSPASTPNETAPIGVTATNSADFVYSASAWANYVIGTSLSVAVTTSQTSYKRNQSVVVTAAVSSQGSPVANASVNFTITEPNGATLSGSSTTSSNGAASFTMKLSRKSPTGTYTAQAHATSGGLSGSGTASCQVQ